MLTLGDSSVGKTSITSRFVYDTFDPSARPTVVMDLQQRQFAGYRERDATLKIWDTAGQERFLTLSSVYYRGAQGVLLVYSVADRNTFSRINLWIGNIDRYCVDLQPPAMILVGNKTDLRPPHEPLPAHCVSRQEGAQLAHYYGIPFFETSAKTGEGVGLAFRQLLDLLMDRDPSIPATDSPVVPVAPDAGDAHSCCFRSERK